MKKIKRLVLAFVILLLTGCSLIFKTIDYKVDTTEFKNVVAYQEEVDIAGLKIVETINGTATGIPVDKSMVTACDPTSSLGEKTLTLTYKEKTFTVKFTVKYRVNFTSGSEILHTQYVTKASEIHAPNDPYKPGYEFDGWSPEIPNAINDNITFEAEFRDTPKEIPNLATSYDAVYGDTLKDIDLPSNAYGKWEFIDTLTTPVGNVGKNTFNVQFTPVNTELKAVKDILNVYVSKMHLDFNFTKLQFDYDGLEHTPLYTLVNTKGETVEDPAITVNYTGQKGKEVGTYFYAYTINSANYEGNAMGYFDVVANKVTITIADSSINLGDTVPNFTLVSSKDDLKPFTYLVEGVDPSVIPLLNIQISVPKINNAGEYDISASVNNENYKEVVVNKGKLTVNKLTLGATDLTITSNPVYGEKLETVTIADDNPNGYWAWVDSNVILDHAGEFEADAVFTPYSQNYELEYRTFKINVAKRILDISITDDENNPNDGYQYVYDGLEHTITYKVEGFVLGDDIDDIEVIGNVKGINAGNTSSKLQIVAANYIGELPVTLVIKKATPVTDFTKVFNNVLLNTRLNQIELPEGYRWDAGSTVLKTVGEGQKFPVTFTPADTVNYETVKGEFTVNVIKHTASITAKDLYTFKYSGEVYTLSGVRASHTESELVYKYFLNGKEIENIRNAGEYRVVITLPESETYYETQIEVVAVVETIGVSPEPSVYDATYGDTLGSILLPTSIYGSWSWKDGNDTLVGDAGENIHVAAFTSSNPNYKSYEVEVKVKVAKKTLDIIVNEEDNIVDYDGLEHSIIYTIEDNIEVEVTGNNKNINAGEYSYLLTIKDDNYQGNIRTKLVINKINPIVEEPLLGENGEIIWNTKANEYNSLLKDGFKFKENYLFDTVGTDLEYTLIYTPADTKNYNTIEVTVYITVSKATPTITYREQAYTYNGKVVTLNASTSNTDGVVLEYSYKLDGVEVNEIKDAGTYEIVITSPASTNYEEVTKTVEVVVAKASAVVLWNVQESYTYSVNGQTLPTVTFVDVFNKTIKLNVLVTDTVNENNDVFKNVSTYKFTALVEEYTNNYEFSNVESEEVEIQKATIDTTNAYWDGNEFAFDAKEHTVTLKGITWPSDVKVEYKENKATNAGEYTAEVSFVYDENNYNTITVLNPTHDWEITALGLQVVWENSEDRTYSAQEFEMPKAYVYDMNLNEKVYLEVSMDKDLFKNVDTYNFVASDSTGNYILIGKETSVEVSSYELSVSWDYEETYVYTSEEIALPSASVVTLENETVKLDVEITSTQVEFKNAGTYDFATAFNNPNYTITNNVLEGVEVNKAEIDMKDVTWDYLEAFTYDKTEHVVNVINVPSLVEATVTGNKATDADTYTAKVSFTYDEDNYELVNNTISDLSWTINPMIIEVIWSEDNYTYTGENLTQPTASYEDVEIKVEKVTQDLFNAAKEYTFKAVTENTNYTISNNTKVYTIKPMELELPNNLKATYGDTLGDVELPSSPYGTWSFDNEETSVGNVGNNTFTIIFTSTDSNYASLEKEVKVAVSALDITVEITSNGGTYNGTITGATAEPVGYVVDAKPEVTLTYTGSANDGTTYNSTEVPSKAGTYIVTATISDKNYKLGLTTATFVVDRATAEITNNLPSSSDYDGLEVDITPYFELNHEEVTLSYDVTGKAATIKDAGTYYIVVSAERSANYKEVATEAITYTVNKIDPTLSYVGETNYTYNSGSSYTINDSDIETNNTDKGYTYTKVITLNGETIDVIHEAGTYNVSITISSTTNFNEKTIEFDIEVAKGSINPGDITTSINATYGQKLGDFDLPEATDGEWSWKDGDSTEVGDVGNRDHIAVFTPTDTSLNTVEKTVTFKVSPRLITITITSETSFEYDTLEKEITYTLSETPDGVSVSVEGEGKATIVGDYSVTFTITGNANYTGSKTVAWEITKATPTYTEPTGLKATYLDTLSSVSLPEGWVWVNPSNLVGAAGSRTHKATFTPVDTHNYNDVTIDLVIEVAKKEYTPTVEATAAEATYGDKLAAITLEGQDSMGKWIWTNTNTYVGNVGTNNHSITFDLLDKANFYVASESLVSVTVNPLDITVSITANGGTYEGIINGATVEPVGYVEGAKPVVTLTYTGVANDGTEYNGTTVPTHAGTYTVTATIADTNYNLTGEVEATFVVNKATPKGTFNVNKTSFEYGPTLGSLNLVFDTTVEGNTTWDDGSATKPEVTKGTVFGVRFTPTDTNNYNVVTSSITLVVDKITTSIDAEDSYTFIYEQYEDFLAELQTTVSPSNNEQTIKFYIDGTEINVSDIKDANESGYAVIARVEETKHYKAASKEITIIVNKKEEEIVLDKVYEYGSTIEDVVPATSTYGEFKVYDEDPRKNVSLVNEESKLLGNANTTKTIWVEFTPYNEYAHNYAYYVKEEKITITRALVTFENIVNEYYYDEKVHTVTYTLGNVVEGDNPEVKGNKEALFVSDSTEVSLVIDEENYYGSIKVELIIHKGTPTTDFTKVYKVEHNTKLGSIKLDEGYVWVAPEQTLSINDNGKTFAAIYTHSDTDNYNPVEGGFVVNVTKIATKLTVNEEDWTNKTYTSSNDGYDVVAEATSGVQPVITIGYNSSTTAKEDDQYVTDSDSKLKDAGTYKIEISVEATETYTAATYTKYVVINQASSAEFNETLPITWEEGLTLSSVAIENNDLGSYAWVDGTKPLDEVKTYECEAIYTPSDTINYKTEQGTFNVKVNKVTVEWNLNDTYSVNYKGSEYTLSDLGITMPHSESEPVVDKELLDAGTYEVTITLRETAHYNKVVKNITVVINAIDVVTPTGLKATYGQILKDVRLPESDYGSWSWKTPTNKVGNAGEQTHYVVFTSNSVNYKTDEYEVKVTVGKAQLEVNFDNPGDLTFDEDKPYGYEDWFTTDEDIALIITLSGKSTTEMKNAGEYKVKVSFEGNDNYFEYEKEYDFVVNPKLYTPTSLPTASEAQYGDKLSNVKLTQPDSKGTWSWKDGTQVLNEVTTLQYLLTFKFNTEEDANNYYVLENEYKASVKVNKKKVTIVILNQEGEENGSTTVSYPYSGSTQYVLYEVEGLIGNDTVTINGNNGWENANVSIDADPGEAYTLSLVSDNYVADIVSGFIRIIKATPVLNLPTFEDEIFYEDRLEDINLTQRATAKNERTNKVVEGDYLYDNPVFTAGTSTLEKVNVRVTFTPEDTVNYSIVEENIEITLKPVAYIGSTYYGTVEKALDASISGETVYVIVGTDPIIRDSEKAVIKNGVTLFLPHTAGVTKNYTRAQCPYHVNSTKCGAWLGAVGGKTCGNALYTTYTDNLTLTMTIDENVTLTNNGTLEISGNLSGGGGGSDAVGHTVGNYAQILLRSGAKIESIGNVNVFGYIKQESKDNGSEVIMNSGTIGMPFILRDFKGGSQTYGIYSLFGEKHYAAFEQYEMRNVQTKLTVKYNASVDGWANIYAGEQQNDTIINLVGKDSGNLIQFTTEYSYLQSTGEFITIDTFNNSPNEAGGFDPIQRQVYKLNINLYGGAQTNVMSLKINVLGSNVDVSTQDVYFGIPYSTTVTLNKAPEQSETAVYTMSQRFKLMTGSKFVVSEGAKLVASDFFIYSKYDYDVTGITSNFMARYYPSGLESAQFIVSGTVEATNLAGPVLLQKGKGSITVSGSTTMTIYTAKTHNGESATGNAVSTWFEDTETLSTKEFIKINKVVDDEVETIEFLLENGKYTPSDISKPGYTFNGWYIGDTLWSTLYPTGINEDVTLKAKFTVNTYDIDYNMYNYQDGSSGTQDAVVDYNETLDSFTVEDGLIRFDTPTHSEGHILKGLYINSTSGGAIPLANIDGQRVYAIEAEELYNHLENDAITVYAVWYQNPLTIEFVNTNYDQQVLDLYHWSIEQNNAGGGTIQIPSTLSYVNSYAFPSFNTYNDDETYDKFFMGWKYNGQIINNLSLTQEQLNTIMNSEEKKVVLEAVWEDKVEISISIGDNSPLGYTFNGGKLTEMLYIHISQLHNYEFYPDMDYTASHYNPNDITYFGGWYSSDKKLETTKLNIDLVEDGLIIIEGRWNEKSLIIYNKEANALNNSLGITSESETKKYYYVPGVETDLLYAPAEVGHTLKWKLNDSISYNPEDITTSTFTEKVVTLTSVYTPKTYKLTVSDGKGQITSIKAGNNSISNGNTFTYGDTITISFDGSWSKYNRYVFGDSESNVIHSSNGRLWETVTIKPNQYVNYSSLIVKTS